MSNLVFVQISVNIKFALHEHAADFWLMFASPVLKRFCSLTCYASILLLQILNANERKKERLKGQVKTSAQTVRKRNGRDVVFKTRHCVLN